MSEYIVATDDHEGHWYTGEEIVRCKDCKHESRDDPRFPYCLRPPAYHEFLVKHDGFCAWGERRNKNA